MVMQIKLLVLLLLINELMNSSNYFINIQFIKYISGGGGGAFFDLRDKLLPKERNCPMI